MDNEKNMDNEKRKDGEFPSESAPRARNRTVMLTPDITGEVRARLAQELGQPLSGAAPHTPYESPATAHAAPDGFLSGRRESHAPAAVAHAAPAVAAPVKEGVVWTQETPIVGFLVSYDKNPNGEFALLRSGRLIVTSDKVSGGNFLLIEDASVSPMHAIMRITGAGEVQVLDQLSEFGTIVQRFGSDTEEELSGDKSSLEHGDTIKFGNRKFHVCIVARGDSAQVV